MFSAKTPPAAPLYLDCWITESGDCLLHWGMKAVDGGGDPITNTLLQYRDTDAEEWASVQDIVQGNSHKFHGTEFPLNTLLQKCIKCCFEATSPIGLIIVALLWVDVVMFSCYTFCVFQVQLRNFELLWKTDMDAVNLFHQYQLGASQVYDNP